MGSIHKPIDLFFLTSNLQSPDNIFNTYEWTHLDLFPDCWEIWILVARKVYLPHSIVSLWSSWTSVLSAQAASPEGDMYKYRNLMVRSLCQQVPQAHLIFQHF